MLNHSHKQLTALARKLVEGQILKVSQAQATLAQWGKIKAMGFIAVSTHLEQNPNPGEHSKMSPPPPQTEREVILVMQIEMLQTKLYAGQRALAAAQEVLSRTADEEGDLFRDGRTLRQIQEALAS